MIKKQIVYKKLGPIVTGVLCSVNRGQMKCGAIFLFVCRFDDLFGRLRHSTSSKELDEFTSLRVRT